MKESSFEANFVWLQLNVRLAFKKSVEVSFVYNNNVFVKLLIGESLQMCLPLR